MFERNVEEEFLFGKPFYTTTKAENVLQTVKDFFKGNVLVSENLVEIIADGTPVMFGSRTSF